MILVDPDVIIDFFAGAQPSAAVFTRLLEDNEALLSSLSVFEIRAGITGKKRLRQIEELLAIVPVLDFDRRQARTAAEIYTTLKHRGTLVGNQDIFLAAAAIEAGVPILTRNVGHFERIPGIEVATPEELSL